MNAFPFFQNEMMNNNHDTFFMGNYTNPGFASSDMGSYWNPLDPTSNPGMNDAGEPNLMALNDGEPVRRTVNLFKFPDGSHNDMLLPGALAFIFSNRSDTEGAPTHILATIGWVNAFSPIQWKMGRANLKGIVDAVASKLNDIISPPVQGGGGGGNGGGGGGGGNGFSSKNPFDMIVQDDDGDDDGEGNGRNNMRNYIRNVAFKRHAGGSALPTKKTYGSSAQESKDLSLAILDAVQNEATFFESYASILLWLEFVQRVDNQNILSDLLTLDSKSLENSILYGHSFASMGYSEKYDSGTETANRERQYRPHVLNEWYSRGSSKNTAGLKVAFYPEKKSTVGRYVSDAKSASFFGDSTTNNTSPSMDILRLKNNAFSDDIINTVETYSKRLKACCLEILHIYARSFNLPKEHAFNHSAPSALPYLLAKQHLNFFRFHGCVEVLEENSESRSAYGQSFSSGPKCGVVSRRRVETKNLWGPTLIEGQALYFVHTRRYRSELNSGEWYERAIIGSNVVHKGDIGYYDPSAKFPLTGRYDAFRALSHDIETKKTPRPSGGLTFSEASTVLKKNKKKSLGKSAEVYQHHKNRGSVPEQRYEKKDWDTMDTISKLVASWEHYGAFCWIPSTGVSLDDLNRIYGYPDVLGAWNPPTIEFVGYTIHPENCSPYSLENLFKTVSAHRVASSSTGSTASWDYVPLSNSEMVNAHAQLPNISISIKK